MVGCKLAKDEFRETKETPELIDTWWDVNLDVFFIFLNVLNELIDTWWDVN